MVHTKRAIFAELHQQGEEATVETEVIHLLAKPQLGSVQLL